MLSKEEKDKINKEAWAAWEADEQTNPNPVNPHAFAYGYLSRATAEAIRYEEGVQKLNEKLQKLQKENQKLKEKIRF